MRRLRALIGVSTAAFLSLAACTGAGSENAEGLATYESDGSGMDALTQGTVTVTAGCLYIQSGNNERWLPVFPRKDVQWDGKTLTTPDGTYTDGDLIELPGGVHSEPTSPRPMPKEYDIPEACSTDYVWQVAPR